MKRYIFLLLCASSVIFAESVVVPTMSDKSSNPLVPAKNNNAKIGIQGEIAAVDPLKILERSLEYREGIQNIEKELFSRKDELARLERDINKKRSDFEAAAATMNEMARKQRIEEVTELQLKYQSKMQTAQQYAQTAEEELRGRILRKVQEVVTDVAKDMGLKIVFAGGVLFADPSMDITDKVIDALNKKYENEQKKNKAVEPTQSAAQVDQIKNK